MDFFLTLAMFHLLLWNNLYEIYRQVQNICISIHLFTAYPHSEELEPITADFEVGRHWTGSQSHTTRISVSLSGILKSKVTWAKNAFLI